MTWLRPVDRTSGTLTLGAGTLLCLAHYGTPLSERCPTTTALEHTTVPMDNADGMPPLGAVKPRQEFFDDIHRGCSPLESGASATVTGPWLRSAVATERLRGRSDRTPAKTVTHVSGIIE
jgi:hypothetical protein